MATNSKEKEDLIVVDLEKLRPTQLACGWQEVEAKEWEILNIKRGKLDNFLKKHSIPVVAGPNGKMYLVDRHHMGLAMLRLSDRWDWEERDNKKENPYNQCFVKIIKDYSKEKMTKEEFYKKLENDGMLHPYNEKGERVDIRDIPMSLADLRDDPYRALAGFARKAGAYKKSTTPYSEFKWADYFRPLIPVKMIKSNIQGAISIALDLAVKPEAKNLPGYTGIKAPGLTVVDQEEELEVKNFVSKSKKLT